MTAGKTALDQDIKTDSLASWLEHVKPSYGKYATVFQSLGFEGREDLHKAALVREEIKQGLTAAGAKALQLAWILEALEVEESKSAPEVELETNAESICQLKNTTSCCILEEEVVDIEYNIFNLPADLLEDLQDMPLKTSPEIAPEIAAEWTDVKGLKKKSEAQPKSKSKPKPKPRPQRVVECPEELVGRLVGKKGKTIRNLEQRSHSKISVGPVKEGISKVTITGLDIHVVDLAWDLIDEVLQGQR